MRGEQVLYCSEDLITTYWETKPKIGDVITISRYELKEGADFNFILIHPINQTYSTQKHDLIDIHTLLNDFMRDVFTQEIQRESSKDYLFSALISSTILFPLNLDVQHTQAIIYGSVQRKHNGANFAIRNDAIFKYYNLISTETKFVTKGFDDLNPSSTLPPIEFLFGSLETLGIDLENKKILYDKNANELFDLFRNIQLNPESFTSSKNFPSEVPPYNISPKNFSIKKMPFEKIDKSKLGRNYKVNVVYPNGVSKLLIKYKLVENDVKEGLCKIIE